MIYKILTQEQWTATKNKKLFAGAPIDLADGFIHFSSPTQVRETASRHFADQNNLVLLGIEETELGPDLKWEHSRNNELFPHLYGPLAIQLIKTVDSLLLDEHGVHTFPPQLNLP